MRKLLSLFFICCVSIVSAQTLIPVNSGWQYYDDGLDQGTGWTAIGFNDSLWDSGTAELGYGDGDENTVVSFGPSSSNKYITTYFRHAFNVVDASTVLSLNLELLLDDGAVIYLNGVELLRQNMPAGTIDYLTTANTAIGGSDESVFTSYNTLSSSALVNGNNVLAVEVHQAGGNSSDISFNLSMDVGANPLAPIVTRGPYLQKTTTNSIVIKWRTNVLTGSKLDYGSVLGTLNQSNSISGLRTDHSITISGLDTNSIYYYSIGDSANVLEGATADYKFKTHPTIGKVQPVRTWILGDCGTADGNQQAVRNAYYNYVSSNGLYTDNALLLGDNAYTYGTDTEYQNAIFNVYDDMLRNTVFWSTLGNHDDFNNSTFYNIFDFPTAAESGGTVSGTENYYSFDYANIHYICLNSQSVNRSPAGAMLTWLTNDLNSTNQDWIVAYFHHPAYTNGSHDSDNAGDSGGRMKDMREYALPILEAGGVDLVLSGHSHSYERTFLLKGHYDVSTTFNSSAMALDMGSGNPTIDSVYSKEVSGTFAGDGAVYITAGSSGKTSGVSSFPMMYTWLNQLGSVVMEVENNEMKVRFLRSTGVFTDEFVIQKSILQPAPIANFSKNDVGCFGDSTGSIDISVSSGNPPFSFVWSNSQTSEDINNLAAGLYTVTVTDNHGLSISTSISIMEPSELNLSYSKRNVSCFGGGDGTATIYPDGGTSPYNYSWNTVPIQSTAHITNLLDSFYTATVIDANGCSISLVVEVRVPTELILFYIPTNPSSPGTATGEINQLVSGGIAPYLYLWSNGFSTEDLINIPAGTYYSTVQDRNGCAIINTITLVD